MQHKAFYFIGIGGIGMSALAKYLMHQGATIGGYDKTPSAITKALEKEGAYICYDDSIAAVKEQFLAPQTTIIYTPAIPKNHPQYLYFLEHNFNVIKRAAMLGTLTQNKTSLAVADAWENNNIINLGSFAQGVNYPFTALIGGIMNDEQSKLLFVRYRNLVG